MQKGHFGRMAITIAGSQERLLCCLFVLVLLQAFRLHSFIPRDEACKVENFV